MVSCFRQCPSHDVFLLLGTAYTLSALAIARLALSSSDLDWLESYTPKTCGERRRYFFVSVSVTSFLRDNAKTHMEKGDQRYDLTSKPLKRGGGVFFVLVLEVNLSVPN